MAARVALTARRGFNVRVALSKIRALEARSGLYLVLCSAASPKQVSAEQLVETVAGHGLDLDFEFLWVRKKAGMNKNFPAPIVSVRRVSRAPNGLSACLVPQRAESLASPETDDCRRSLGPICIATGLRGLVLWPAPRTLHFKRSRWIRHLHGDLDQQVAS
jgi:hypothetical protein